MAETTLCQGCRHRLVSTLRAAAEILADPAAGSAAPVAADVAIPPPACSGACGLPWSRLRALAT